MSFVSFGLDRLRFRVRIKRKDPSERVSLEQERYPVLSVPGEERTSRSTWSPSSMFGTKKEETHRGKRNRGTGLSFFSDNDL